MVVSHITTSLPGSMLLGSESDFCRPGVFLTARADGRLDVWDLFYKQNDPVLSLHLADRSLTSIRLQVSNTGPGFCSFMSVTNALICHASHCHDFWPLFMFFHVCHECIHLPCRGMHHVAMNFGVLPCLLYMHAFATTGQAASHCHEFWPLFLFFHVCYECIALPCRGIHHTVCAVGCSSCWYC